MSFFVDILSQRCYTINSSRGTNIEPINDQNMTKKGDCNMAKLDSAKRYRFTVPSQDAYVQEWIEAQINLSTSIRTLIREDIQKNGYTDVTCREVEQRPKVGRPTTAEVEKRKLREVETEQENVGRDYVEDVVTTPVPIQHTRYAQPAMAQNTSTDDDPNMVKLREMGIMD